MNAPAEAPQIEATAALPPPSPGALLKLARERAGIGVDDLASQLKLARSTVEALEHDDFASLSEPVYVRGYYRKIAKALGTPEKELIDAYLALHPSQAAPVRPQPLPLAGGVDAGITRRAQGQGILVIGVIVALSVVLLVLLGEPPRTARLAKPVAEPVAVPEAPPVEAAAQSGTAPATEEAAVTTTPAATPFATPSPLANPAPAKPALATVAAAPAPTPATASSAPLAAPAAGATQLVLNFTESSFVRIEDSRGRTLLIGLVRGGEQPVLDGQPPYTVFLGNAKNVKVFRGGKAVDFSADVNAQNDTARFTVP